MPERLSPRRRRPRCQIFWPGALALIWLAISSAPVAAGDETQLTRHQVVQADVWGSVSSDGRQLAYVDWGTGNLNLRNLQTGEVRKLTDKGSWMESTEFGMYPVFSSTGERVAYSWFGEKGSWDLRIQEVEAATAKVLYGVPTVLYVEPHAWSPDDRQVLVRLKRHDSNQIALVAVQDGSVKVLESLDWRAPLTMCFALGGDYVIYDLLSGERTPKRDIYMLSTRGGERSTLVPHPANDRLLGCAPDGEHILFASDRSGSWDAWLLEVSKKGPEGSPVRVSRDLDPITRSLGFSREGAFYYGLHSGEAGVYVAQREPETGKLQTPWKLSDRGAWNTSLDWSPDGRWLAHIGPSGAVPFDLYGQALVLHSVETGQKRTVPLKMSGFHTFLLQWSPDGSFLLAQARDHGGREGFYRIDPETGAVAPLLQEERCPNVCVEWPALASDERLFFVRWSDSEKLVVVRDLATGNETEIERVALPHDIERLSVSPDSRWLASIRGNFLTGASTLSLMPTAGGPSRHRVRVQPPQRLSALAWSPDSAFIIYAIQTMGAKGGFELWQVRADEGEPESLGLVMEHLVPNGLGVHPDGKSIAFGAGTPRRSEVWVMDLIPALD